MSFYVKFQKVRFVEKCDLIGNWKFKLKLKMKNLDKYNLRRVIQRRKKKFVSFLGK